jgi:Cu/Ag efflux protein CusF
MKRGFVYVLVVLFALSVGVGAMAQEKAPAKAKPEKAAAKAKPGAKRERVVNLTGTVEAVDMANRVVTIKGSKGRVIDLKVGEEAKNLDQVKVGDKVVAKYYESIAYRLKKPGEAEGVKAEQATAGAKAGEVPAAAVANQVTVTATVEDISPKKTYVTLKSPEGKTVDVRVMDPKNIEGLKVGDKVVITYTQALAIALDKPKPAPEKK